MYTVTFKFEQQGREAVTIKNVDAGQTLLEVALNHDIALHHNCGGVCSCSTCHLYVDQGIEHLEETSRKEKTFIARASHPRPNSRLGCQSLLLEGRGIIVVTVPDQAQF